MNVARTPMAPLIAPAMKWNTLTTPLPNPIRSERLIPSSSICSPAP